MFLLKKIWPGKMLRIRLNHVSYQVLIRISSNLIQVMDSFYHAYLYVGKHVDIYHYFLHFSDFFPSMCGPTLKYLAWEYNYIPSEFLFRCYYLYFSS